jgi:hypothetical protein
MNHFEYFTCIPDGSSEARGEEPPSDPPPQPVDDNEPYEMT